MIHLSLGFEDFFHKQLPLMQLQLLYFQPNWLHAWCCALCCTSVRLASCYIKIVLIAESVPWNLEVAFRTWAWSHFTVQERLVWTQIWCICTLVTVSKLRWAKVTGQTRSDSNSLWKKAIHLTSSSSTFLACYRYSSAFLCVHFILQWCCKLLFKVKRAFLTYLSPTQANKDIILKPSKLLNIYTIYRKVHSR